MFGDYALKFPIKFLNNLMKPVEGGRPMGHESIGVVEAVGAEVRTMKKGDLVFYYHSGDAKEVVGLARVDTDPYPDPTATEGDWTAVDLVRDKGWHPPGQLKHVDIFTDGLEDVALVFHFDSEEQFSVVLCDTDVRLGRDLELFEDDPNGVVPVFRTRVS